MTVTSSTSQNTISKAEAARRLRVSDGTVTKFVGLNSPHLRSDDRGRPYAADIAVLAAQRDRLVLQPGSATGNTPQVFACPTTSQELGGHLELRNQDEAIQIGHEALKLSGRESLLTPPRFLTGAWEITEANAIKLASNNGYLLGVVGGFVLESVRVIAYLGQVPYRMRKVFLVEPVTDKAVIAKLQGFIPGMQQTPFEILTDL